MVDTTQVQNKKTVSESHPDLDAHIWRMSTVTGEKQAPSGEKVKVIGALTQFSFSLPAPCLKGG